MRNFHRMAVKVVVVPRLPVRVELARLAWRKMHASGNPNVEACESDMWSVGVRFWSLMTAIAILVDVPVDVYHSVPE